MIQFIIFSLSFLTLIVVGLLLSFDEIKVWRKNWQEIADFTSLQFEDNNSLSQSLLYGTYAGRNLCITFHSVGGFEGVLPSRFTKITIELNRKVDLYLLVQKRTIFPKDGIQIQDKNFGMKYVIGGSPIYNIKQLLSSKKLCRNILEADCNQININNTWMELVLPGDEFEKNKLLDSLLVGYDLAYMVERLS